MTTIANNTSTMSTTTTTTTSTASTTIDTIDNNKVNVKPIISTKLLKKRLTQLVDANDKFAKGSYQTTNKNIVPVSSFYP